MLHRARNLKITINVAGVATPQRLPLLALRSGMERLQIQTVIPTQAVHVAGVTVEALDITAAVAGTTVDRDLVLGRQVVHAALGLAAATPSVEVHIPVASVVAARAQAASAAAVVVAAAVVAVVDTN